jgi:ubiquitin-like protein ATG12
MSASVVLTSLPRDAHQALADAEAIDTGKGMNDIVLRQLPFTFIASNAKLLFSTYISVFQKKVWQHPYIVFQT